MAASLLKSIGRFHRTFTGLVDVWLNAIRELPEEGSGQVSLTSDWVLPWTMAPKNLLRPQTVVTGFVDRLSLSPDEQIRAEVEDQLNAIAADLTSASEQLLQRLCDVAWEIASRRVLLPPQDSLDVTSTGALASLSMANLMFAHAQSRRQPREPLDDEVQEAVRRPLKWAAERIEDLRPGDLWLLDLYARTVRLAPRPRLDLPGPNTWQTLLDQCLPEYVSISLVHKLVDANQLGGDLAKRCKYRKWPGLELVINGADASGLRALLLGELAPRVTSKDAGPARGALVRFLEAILAFKQPEQQMAGRLFIAQLFWEMLEQDASALNPFCSDKRYIDVFRSALLALDEDLDDLPLAAQQTAERLSEILLCLRTYDEYCALEKLVKPFVVPAGRATRKEKATYERTTK